MTHRPPDPVDEQVLHFQADAYDDVYVLGTDRNLWHEDGTKPVYWNVTHRHWVDRNALGFTPLDATYVYVLGTDGKLWREKGDMTSRVPVDQHLFADLATAGRGFRYDADVLAFYTSQGPFQPVALGPLSTAGVSECPPNTAAPHSGLGFPNASPPCIYNVTEGIVYGTSAGVHWTTVPYEVNCNPGDTCKWASFTNDYDQYNVRYGYAEDDTGKWEQHNYGGTYTTYRSITGSPEGATGSLLRDMFSGLVGRVGRTPYFSRSGRSQPFVRHLQVTAIQWPTASGWSVSSGLRGEKPALIT
jgi:hypothetical protein